MVPGKKILVIGLMVVGGMALAACGAAATATPTMIPATAVPNVVPTAIPTIASTSTPSFSTGFKSKDPNTFVELTIGGPDTLDPALAYDNASGGILQAVYDTLVLERDL